MGAAFPHEGGIQSGQNERVVCMERTISMMVGKGSLNHNNRTFIAKNVDSERSKGNKVYVKENIKKVYHTLFDEALEAYNAKQSRADRRIDNYYEKIRTGKQEKLFHELIVQIGNRYDTNCNMLESVYAQSALEEYMMGFQERNPNLRVFNAVMHLDEETPHLHIDYVPFSTGNKRGLETKVSLKGALKAQGFVGTGRFDTEWKCWVESEKQCLAEIMEHYQMKWLQKGTHEKHLSVYDYEQKMRKAEVEELEQEISGSKEELSSILHQQTAAEQETEQIRKEGEAIRQEVSELSATNHLLKEQTETLTEDREKLLSENEKLEKQQKKLQQELNKMVQSKEVMERNIHAYDEDVKWQLAEPGALMSAKSYRDKKALPLVEKLKEIVKSLTIKCVQLTEQGKKLTAKVDGQKIQISRLTDKVMEQSDTIDRLQEKVADLGRLERHLGREQVQSIVERSKALEQSERANKHPKRAFEMSR